MAAPRPSSTASVRAFIEGAKDPAHLGLALAPMEGVSDAVVRALLSELGGMDLCVTEFIRVTERAVPARILRASCPELDAGGRTPSGTPVTVQLLGSNVPALAETAVRAVELGAPGIDLNFGCPARRVNGHDGGAAVLKTPARVETIVGGVRRALPAGTPLTAKIRLGWDTPEPALDIVRAAEAGGAALVTIHGRTKTDMYRPPANWARIGEARAAVGVPVVANGDLFGPAAVQACREVTGCGTFMLGRGAFRIPNLFRWVRGMDDAPSSSHASIALLRRFVVEMPKKLGLKSPERATLARLKQWTRAMGEADPELRRCFEGLKRCAELPDALEVLDRAFPADTDPSDAPSSGANMQDSPSLVAESHGL